MEYNEFNQPIGESVIAFKQRSLPKVRALEGQYCRLEKLDYCHQKDLFNYFCDKADAPNWTYLPDEQPQNFQSFMSYIEEKINSTDPYFFAIIDKETSEAVGILALLRIDSDNASIEVGHVHYANVLKHTRIATEVQFVLAKYVFETLGYRRYEWKCDALNEPSIKAAKRLGFKFEGIFRNHKVYKNRNRDTYWLAMIDKDWYINKLEFENWLEARNFDEAGNQVRPLKI
ncbi:GNAT family N-acetyltransferase [Staphylococcus edaphicus]|uniref:GNAT family N-acetyltransferase n=1 Tax=Staphylococcus edaphicus TaxID=1955013 RepID=A0A2C6WSL5_9STAP|nr:GNAT family protein [Staphylococcus edaphicus]PHK50746.1 GNAT family N-acetyltransferase [Staphylococcus edaphicus]UQW82784.1 GNAT family N-acetyltransferase [Staphylococcus edaphicus]